MSIAPVLLISVSAPTVLFLVTIFWHFSLHDHLFHQIRDIPRDRRRLSFDDVGHVVFYHFLETLFAEAIVLFVLNGLIIIVELSELVPGILFLIVGLILSITGLMLAFMSESDLDIPRHLEATFILIVGFACGEFGFIVGSQTDPKTEFNLFFGAFLVGLLMTYAFLQWFIE